MRLNALEKSERVILVVDDELTILRFVTLVLENSGFTILPAESGEDALQKSRSHAGPIHLMLSNIQMSGMSGLDLATIMSTERPDIKVMLMSGFNAGLLVLNDGWHFLRKPFIPSQLRDLIALVLSQPAAPDLNEQRHPTVG